MPSDQQLRRLSARAGRRLLRAHRRVVTAESCTGGWLAKAMTDVPGSSQWLECGYVTYSNAAKMRDLAVSERTLRRYGAVSEQTVREMARGALRVAGADLAVAVTGIAGPEGGTRDKPVGTVWFCIAVQRAKGMRLEPSLRYFKGNREAIRRAAVAHALRLILRHAPAGR